MYLAQSETEERFEPEKQAYWRQRDELLQQYVGKWNLGRPGPRSAPWQAPEAVRQISVRASLQ
jgi:hypothetical protein